MPSNEIDRIQAAYRHYRDNKTTQAQWSKNNPGNQAIIRERTRILTQILQARQLLSLADHHILEIGCGTGHVLASLKQWAAKPEHLWGIDLLAHRLKIAGETFPDFHFQQANAAQLNFSDEVFDIVLIFTVFTSILDNQMADDAAADINRVMKPGGVIIWYDFRYNNPNNPHVRGMNRTSIRTLFPDFDIKLQTITLLPPLARRLGRLTPTLYPPLARIPWLRTHFIGLLTKPIP